MIGDYITFAESLNDEQGPLIFQVVALNCPSEGEALMLLKGEKACDEMEIDDEWSGIPITPAILEQNGFNSWEHGYMLKERIGMRGQTTSASSPIEIIIYEGSHSVIMNPHEGKEFQGSIDNVHELQHALRLCGIDKEVVL